jgi:hypothetical protein
MQSMRSPGEKGELPSGLGKIGGFAKQPLLAARGLIRSEDKGVRTFGGDQKRLGAREFADDRIGAASLTNDCSFKPALVDLRRRGLEGNARLLQHEAPSSAFRSENQRFWS